jgi:hypothetical protein
MIVNESDESPFTRTIKQSLAQSTTPTKGMELLLAYCEEVAPWSGWRHLYKLNYQEDLLSLKTWLESLLASDPPSDAIVAFWFGLFIGVLNENDQEKIYLYLSGSTEYDSETADWSGWREDSYLPDGRYVHSEVLNSCYRITSEGDEYVSDLGANLLCLGYACLAVRYLCQTITHIAGSGEIHSMAITVGFDDGDYINLGKVGRGKSFSPEIDGQGI